MSGVLALIILSLLILRAWRKPGVLIGAVYLFFLAEQFAITSFPTLANRSWLLNVVFGVAVISVLAKSIISRGYFGSTYISVAYYPHLAFLALCLVSSFWALDRNAVSRMFEMLPYVLFYGVIVPMLANDSSNVDEAFAWLGLGGGLLCLVFIFNAGDSGSASRMYLEADIGEGTQSLNPLAVGEAAGYALICITFARFPKTTLLTALRFVLAIACLVVVGRTGRGELFSVGIALVLATTIDSVGLTKNLFSLRKALLYFIIVVVGMTTLYFGIVVTSYWERYAELGDDLGTLERRQMIELAIQHFVNHPQIWLTGEGWGSTYVICGFYPHNGFVQALAELGVLGTALWGWSILTVLTKASGLVRFAADEQIGREALKSATTISIFAIAVNQKSGDCVDVIVAMSVGITMIIAERTLVNLDPKRLMTYAKTQRLWGWALANERSKVNS